MAEKPKYREMGRLERAGVEGTTAAQRKAGRTPEGVISRAIKSDKPLTVEVVEEMLAKMRVLDSARESKSKLPSGTVRIRDSKETKEARKFFTPSFLRELPSNIQSWGGKEEPRRREYTHHNWKDLEDAAQIYLKGQRRQKAAKARIKGKK